MITQSIQNFTQCTAMNLQDHDDILADESMGVRTPEQFSAVQDFNQQMGEIIWQHHSVTMIEQLRKQERCQNCNWQEASAETKLSLPI